MNITQKALRFAALSLENGDEREEALDALIESVVDGQTADKMTVGGVPVTAEVYAQAARFMVKGRKIQAIKALRRESGVGLIEGKDAVEREFPR